MYIPYSVFNLVSSVYKVIPRLVVEQSPFSYGTCRFHALATTILLLLPEAPKDL